MNDQLYADAVKQALIDCINDLDSVKWLFLQNPQIDFTRNRKFSFGELIKIMLMMDGGTVQNELLKFFDFDDDTPTKSAYCQQRANSAGGTSILILLLYRTSGKPEQPSSFS